MLSLSSGNPRLEPVAVFLREIAGPVPPTDVGGGVVRRELVSDVSNCRRVTIVGNRQQRPLPQTVSRHRLAAGSGLAYDEDCRRLAQPRTRCRSHATAYTGSSLAFVIGGPSASNSCIINTAGGVLWTAIDASGWGPTSSTYPAETPLAAPYPTAAPHTDHGVGPAVLKRLRTA